MTEQVEGIVQIVPIRFRPNYSVANYGISSHPAVLPCFNLSYRPQIDQTMVQGSTVMSGRKSGKKSLGGRE